MPYDGQLLARARAQLDKIRSANEAEHLRRLRLVYGRIPEIERIDDALRAQMRELLSLTIRRPADLAAQIAALEKAYCGKLAMWGVLGQEGVTPDLTQGMPRISTA